MSSVPGGRGEGGGGGEVISRQSSLDCFTSDGVVLVLLLPSSLHFAFLSCFGLLRMLEGSQRFSREVLLTF